MVAGFVRVISTGVPLLLAATTTTTTTTTPAHAADAHEYACGAEITACQEDETCNSCSSVTEGGRAVVDRCTEAAIADATDSSSLYCLSNVAAVCCLDDISEKECLENDRFVKYWMCELDDGGCWLDKIACGNDRVEESVSGSGSSSSSSSSPAAGLAGGSNVIA